jgi:hypothetical protein
MRLSVPVILLVLANLTPIIGVVWWDWSVFSVMLLFWLENIIVGLLNIPRILFASGDSDPRQSSISNRFFVAVFFCVHYGMFTFGHGVFVFSVFGQGIESDPSVQLVLQLVMEHQLQWAVLALFISHLVSLILNYFLAGEYRVATVKQMMKNPYSRVLVLHLGVIFGGFLLDMLNAPLMGLAVLIAIKIVVDVRAHRKEHRELSATIPMSSEPQ